MKSKEGKEKITEARRLKESAIFWDNVAFELENLILLTSYHIRIYPEDLQLDVVGLPLEEVYLLCGTVKEILERNFPELGFVKWTREDWPQHRDIDFITRICDKTMRISSTPS